MYELLRDEVPFSLYCSYGQKLPLYHILLERRVIIRYFIVTLQTILQLYNIHTHF